MKTKLIRLMVALSVLALPALVQAQFTFTTNNGAITITGYNTAAGLDVVIPAMTNGYPVTSIGDVAFLSSGITNVIIPTSVTSIGYSAFASSGLTSVTIPNSVTNIGSYAFENFGLTSITVDASNPAYSSTNGVLFDKVQATLLQFPGGLGGSYPIPNSVTSIGPYAFNGSTRLTNVTFPNSVTSIGYDAFADCYSLTSVTIPNSVTNIGGEAFSSDFALTRVTIPNSVTSIGNYAFAGTSLTSVTIPNSVTYIGDYAFDNCSSLTSAYFQGNAPYDNGTVFTGYPSKDPATVYYLTGTTGWGSTFGGVPAVLWNPQANSFSFTGGQFGFNLTGPADAVIVVEACTNLSHPVWLPVSTNTLSGLGTSVFSDTKSGGYPMRYYRFRSP